MRERQHRSRSTIRTSNVAALPTAVLLTVRSDEPATAAVEATVGRVAPVRPEPLAGPEVEATAAACLGVPAAPAELVVRLQRASGPPLVIEDLVALDVHPGPLRYAEIVSPRLAAALDPTARGVLDAAALRRTGAVVPTITHASSRPSRSDGDGP